MTQTPDDDNDVSYTEGDDEDTEMAERVLPDDNDTDDGQAEQTGAVEDTPGS